MALERRGFFGSARSVLVVVGTIAIRFSNLITATRSGDEVVGKAYT
jgi:hypothetical protein